MILAAEYFSWRYMIRANLQSNFDINCQFSIVNTFNNVSGHANMGNIGLKKDCC